MESLNGWVERITYYNPENGYTVLRLQVGEEDNKPTPLTTVVGTLPELAPGEYVQFEGEWVTHPRHGKQFAAKTCRQSLPASAEGIRRYLGSGLIKGIGPKLAERIVDTFGEQTLEIIEHHPERLHEVPDIGEVRARLLWHAWQEQKQIKDIMLFLYSHGISTNLAVKIYKTYGDNAANVVHQDPYRLARDIFGVGFKTADRIARELGLAKDHPSRVEAGLVYSLNQMSAEGHTFVPLETLLESTAELLELEQDIVAAGIDRLQNGEDLIIDQVPAEAGSDAQSIQAVYLTPHYVAEVAVATLLGDLLKTGRSRMHGAQSLLMPQVSLSEEQNRAVHLALSSPVAILTGGPGTGKTTTIKALVSIAKSAGKKIALASPTGRAAKRLSEATGKPASTIHRLLGYKPGEGFTHHPGHPLPADMLVIDEASMLDLPLAYHLLRAVRPGTHILFVGDVDQLPSVGVGDVLRQMIASQVIPTLRLQKIFRQAQGSHIITNAHRINRGEMPVFSKASADDETPPGDFFLFPAADGEEAARWVLEVVTQRIPRRFGFDPLADVQVLAPMYRGAVGVDELNAQLQAALNPPARSKAERNLGGRVFRVGDKVMQIQNDYEKDVYNGDIGILTDINLEEHSLSVDFGGQLVRYDWLEHDQLVHAYAVTVHKSQGSEFPAVVMPLVTQHYIMLQRNLLYTGVTRARQLCVLVGNKRAISIAVRNNKPSQRYTALAWRLQVTVRGA